MSEYTARLENWLFHMVTNKEGILLGECYEDSLGRFEDGTTIKTSGVKARLLREGDVVQSRNNTYLLGKKWDENYDSAS